MPRGAARRGRRRVRRRSRLLGSLGRGRWPLALLPQYVSVSRSQATRRTTHYAVRTATGRSVPVTLTGSLTGCAGRQPVGSSSNAADYCRPPLGLVRSHLSRRWHDRALPAARLLRLARRAPCAHRHASGSSAAATAPPRVGSVSLLPQSIVAISFATSSSEISWLSPAKSSSGLRKSMQWHSCLSRMGTHGQFQKPSLASACLSS